MSDNFFCDDCEIEFTLLDSGFIGSLNDFEFRKLPLDEKLQKELETFECSPFLNYVQLCKDCYSLKNK